MPLLVARPFKIPSLPAGVSDLTKTLSEDTPTTALGDPRVVWHESRDNPLDAVEASTLTALGDPRIVWWENRDNPLDVVENTTMGPPGT